MIGKKLPYIHRRDRQWASTDLTPQPYISPRKIVTNPLNHLLRTSRERHLSRLEKSLSPVGNKAKLDFIDTYKNMSMLSQNNHINKLDASPSLAYLEEVDKIHLNPEPFGIVRRSGPEASIDIHLYSMGDAYAKAFSEGINKYKEVKDLNLTNNRLSDEGCGKILQKIKSKKIKKICLAENKLGNRSIVELVQILSFSDCKLKWLDIENIGAYDKLVASLCKAIENNKSLQHLNIAKNSLGFFSACALNSMLKTNNCLKRLDLHWNSFRTQGAVMLFEGLEVNKNLVELDLSWNSLGRDSGLEVARSLGKALKNNKELLHLDLSYNYFSKNECEVLAELIKSNHTLIGLHALGNDCILDSKGFIIPLEYSGKIKQSHFFSRILNQSTHKLKKRQHGNCWICDKWVEVVFKWIPAQSGEASIPPIYIHLEPDNYAGELMTKQKDGTFSITRVVPPGKIFFFFSNRAGPMKSNDHKTLTLPKPIIIDNEKSTSVVNVNEFEGEVCKIKEPFRSKARMLGDAFQASATEYEKVPWSINISVFKDYRLDSVDFLIDCFEFDWKASKLVNFVKNPEIQEQVKQLLKNNYDVIAEAYKTLSAYSGNELFCITQNVFIDFLNQCGLIDHLFQVSDLGVNWNSANAGKEKGETYNAGNGLCRYEFMEILVRIANDRYVRNKICKNAAESFEKALIEHYITALKTYDTRVFRKEVYMAEEIDYFIKAHKIIFETLFKKYSGKKGNPGQKPFTSLEEFRQLCNDAGIISESFTTREIDVCYSQSMMTQIDILFKKRHLEMNYNEFLEAISRAANMTSVVDNPSATLKEKFVAMVDHLLSVCPSSISENFTKPTEETYFKMMYKAKAY